MPSPSERVASPPWTGIGVVALCFVLIVISRGASESFAVFLLPLSVDLAWDRGQVTSVYAIMMIAFALASPLAGILFDRFGPRVTYGFGLSCLVLGYGTAGWLDSLWQFYLFLGVLGGVGAAAVGLVPASALIGRWFSGRLTTAMGIASSGLGFGALFFAPVAELLIAAHGWRLSYGAVALLFAGFLPLVLILPWARLARGRADSAAGPLSAATASDLASVLAPLAAAARTPAFWALAFAYLFTGFGVYSVTLQSVAFLVAQGFAPMEAAGAFGATGVMTCLGMMMVGYAADRFGAAVIATLSYVFTAMGVICLALVQVWPTWAMIAGYVICIGGTMGVRSPIIQAVAARRFAGPGLGAVIGTISIGQGLGAGGGAVAAGLLHDLTGGYGMNFVFSLASIVAAASLFWLVTDLRRAGLPQRSTAVPQERDQND